jgi:hypothetical protein
MLLRSAGPGFFPSIGFVALLAAALAAVPARAQTPLFNEVHTIAAPTTGVPQEYTFSVSVAGTYTVTLTDLGAALTPSAPLAAVKLAVTSGNALIGAPIVGAGTLTLSSLAPGVTYKLHVVGMPGNVPGSGPFGIQVNDASMTQIAAFQGALALPSQALPNGEKVLDDSFMVTSSGSYTVALADLQLPQSLTTLTLLLIAQGGTTPLAILPNAGALQATVTLTAGVTYDIFAVGQADPAVNAGLYSAVVTAGGPGGAVVFGRAVPVGNTVSIGSPGLKAGSNTLSLTDLKYPVALLQVGAVLTLNGQVVAQLGAAGSSPPFAASSDTYEAFAVGIAPSGAPGAGSYAVQVTPQGAAPAFSAARAVTAAGSAVSAYSFDASLAVSGAYNVNLTDFQFPANFVSLGLAAVQAGALLGTPLTRATTLGINAAPGPLSLLVFAQSATGGGLFGIDVAPGAGGSAVFDVTQGVGALFIARQVSIPAAGNYAVTAADLGFPAGFANYDTIVTQGTTQLGQIFGGGTFFISAAAAGNYFVNFIAQPTGPDQAGTYALTLATAPPPPVLSFSADNTQVASGGTVDLIWSVTNADSCTASGGWSGMQNPRGGTFTTAALTATTTFTLACTGGGQTVNKSVTVTVSAAASGHGGGGMLDLTLLLMLIALLGYRRAVATH